MKKLYAVLAVAAMSLLGAQMSQAQAAKGPLDPSIKRTYVSIGRNGDALLYEPVTAGEKSRIALLVMHSDGNYLTHSACTEMSKRGYRVLCTTRSSPSGDSMDKAVADVKQAMAYLRTVPGVQKVVLLGHSGGATLMTSYQMIGENGVKSCQGPEKIHKCPESLAGSIPADGIMLVDANWGNAEMSLFSIDPAVTDESTGKKLDQALNLFNPANGFNPSGSANYSKEFVKKFQAGVAQREKALTQKALERLAAIEAGNGLYDDDEPFIAPGISQTSNKLFAQDTKLMSHTVKPWTLLHAGGKETTEIVYTVRPPRNLQPTTGLLERGSEQTTVRTFLTNHAIRVADDFGYDESSVHGIDWTSTYSSPPGNVQSIHNPLLVMGMTGSWEYLASETIFEKAASTDKTLAFVEGGSHVYTTCKECEKTPGQFGDTQKTTYDYVDQWLSKKGRF